MIHPLQSAIPWTHWSQFIGLYHKLISSDAQWKDKKCRYLGKLLNRPFQEICRKLLSRNNGFGGMESLLLTFLYYFYFRSIQVNIFFKKIFQNLLKKNPNKFRQKSRQLVIKYLYVRYSIRLQKRLFQSF